MKTARKPYSHEPVLNRRKFLGVTVTSPFVMALPVLTTANCAPANIDGPPRPPTTPAAANANHAPRTKLLYVNQNSTRNRPVTPLLERRLTEGVETVFGDGFTVQIYSGGQDRKGFGNRRTGSIRHDDFGNGGRAADIYLLDPEGDRVRGLALAQLGQFWLAANFGSVGHEMRGGGIHLDEWVIPPPGGGRFWTYRASEQTEWGEQAKAMLARGAAGHFP